MNALRSIGLLAVLLAALLLAGCYPQALYVWSPDGKWMTAAGNDGKLYLADSTGHLLPGPIDGGGLASWFPDSRHVLVARSFDAASWDEVARYLTPEQTKSVVTAAAQIRTALMTYDWTAPKADTWDAFKEHFNAAAKQNHEDNALATLKNLDGSAGIYLRDHADDTLRQKIPADRWKELAGLTQKFIFVQVYGVDSSGFSAGATLLTTVSAVGEVRVSPTGAAALIVINEGDEQDIPKLLVAPTDASRPPLQIAEGNAVYPDFSPDGRDVALIRATDISTHANDSSRLGSLARIHIVGNDGKLLQKVDPPQDLVGLLFDSMTRVRWLKDGRIVFATVQVSLPCTAADMPQRASLFCVTPDKQAVVTRMLPQQAQEQIGDSAQYFEISPDARRACIPDDSGTVCVVDLTNGSVTKVQAQPTPDPTDQNKKASLMTLPMWRNNDELTFFAPAPDGQRQVVLYSLSKNTATPLSGTWPSAMLSQSPATQPATQPTK